MTHFTVGIIVPEDRLPHTHDFVTDQMTPYDENLRVDPYVCYSVEQARSEIERDLQRLERIIERQDSEYNLDKCRELVARLRTTTPEQKYREYLGFHESFNARGEPISTSNPAGKWDWYTIGGRWDGWINGIKSTRGRVADNLAPTEQALERGVIPHAIITPDGQWQERGQMGWWAILITENERWDAKARELLASHPGHHVLIVDAHI